MTPPTNNELTLLVESAEALAYTDLMRSAPHDWNWRADQSEALTMLVAPTLNHPLFNRVIGLGLGEPANEGAIESIVRVYSTAGIKNFAVQLSPHANPPQLPEWLAAHGLSARDNWAKVYRSDRPVVTHPTTLRIEKIGRKKAEIFAALTCTSFRMPDVLQPWLRETVERPGWHHYLAWDGAEAVAGAAMFISKNVAWLGVAGTHPAHRRKGAQGSLMARRIRDAIDLGCKWIVTETGEDTPARPNSSFHNVMRNGFDLAYQRPNYMPAV